VPQNTDYSLDTQYIKSIVSQEKGIVSQEGDN
ncbi:MAG: hypothetical protein ACI9UK_002032, partial [Candidatus Krumholzibacteriia bacterium]